MMRCIAYKDFVFVYVYALLIYGFVYDVKTGRLKEVAGKEREKE
jgi:hypothetical protein